MGRLADWWKNRHGTRFAAAPKVSVTSPAVEFQTRPGLPAVLDASAVALKAALKKTTGQDATEVRKDATSRTVKGGGYELRVGGKDLHPTN